MVSGSDLSYTVMIAFDEFPEATTVYMLEEDDYSALITAALITLFCLIGVVLLAAAIFYMLRQ